MPKLFALRAIRERRGLTQTELAAKVHITQSWLSNLELGKRATHGSTHRKLARALKVDPAELMGDQDRFA
jgi:transcriptional regulator with XRE-family HTH domain